ncbi:lysylphosphatidylglycerol synthase transmembrane domain-containing protein [Allohahella sp. A8]|uniref:lysylphosphatidylglycerol synthase transmembrane domain-containing protein n=1 Tax=Allohahella sp. A8 TaxID=3141461 RepID=UPI003A807883
MLALLTGPVVRLVISASLLIGVLALADLEAVWQQFLSVHNDADDSVSLGWIILALAASLPQYLLSARRWQVTAFQLGLELSYAKAVSAYYKATFFNQVLPGGVLGDVSRALEHGRQGTMAQRFTAWRAVAIERLAGQLVLVLAVVLTLPFVSSVAGTPAASITSLSNWSTTLTVGALTLPLAAYMICRNMAFVSRLRVGLHAFAVDIARAWLVPALLARQLLLSLGVLASYVISYFALAHAFGFSGDLWWLCSVILLVLLSMSLPLSVAGWGVREMSAAGLWLAGGQDAAAGLAIAVAYGLLNLVCSLPGLWFMLRERSSVSAD